MDIVLSFNLSFLAQLSFQKQAICLAFYGCSFSSISYGLSSVNYILCIIVGNSCALLQNVSTMMYHHLSERLPCHAPNSGSILVLIMVVIFGNL